MQSEKLIGDIRRAVEKSIVGKKEAIDLLLTALCARGHVLIEDVPGIGKTTLVSSLAKALHLDFSRIQFTPDITPADITGFSLFDMSQNQFVFHPGSVMSQVVLADEINRTSPKTQSSLLEAMQERQVTVDGKTYPLPTPFMVMATQNPVDFAGTYPLPEAQLDRFLLRVSMGYPTMMEEVEIITRAQHGDALTHVEPVATPSDVLGLQEYADNVRVDGAVKEYVAAFCARTRESPDLSLGASPRAAIALVAAARGYALVKGREYVIPDDIQYLLTPVLAHRIMLKPEARLREMTPERVLRNIMGALRVPGSA